MPAHLSIGTALDKNKIASGTVYLLLLEVDILNPTNINEIIETIYCTNNNENYTWNGQVYTSIPFDVELQQDSKTAPSCTLTLYDTAQIFQAQLQAYGYALQWPARFKVVNATIPNALPEIEQDFEIMSAVCKEDNYAIQFTIGAENPLTLRFPPRQQFIQRCFWRYMDGNCLYSGTLPSCDYSLDGANGCRVHNNVINYGGFPGIHQTNGNPQ